MLSFLFTQHEKTDVVFDDTREAEDNAAAKSWNYDSLRESSDDRDSELPGRNATLGRRSSRGEAGTIDPDGPPCRWVMVGSDSRGRSSDDLDNIR